MGGVLCPCCYEEEISSDEDAMMGGSPRADGKHQGKVEGFFSPPTVHPSVPRGASIPNYDATIGDADDQDGKPPSMTNYPVIRVV